MEDPTRILWMRLMEEQERIVKGKKGRGDWEWGRGDRSEEERMRIEGRKGRGGQKNRRLMIEYNNRYNIIVYVYVYYIIV